MSLVTPLRNVWRRAGHRVDKTPRLKRLGRYQREMSTMAAVILGGKVFHKHFAGAMNSEKVIAGLAHFRHHLLGRWLLIWDGAGTHGSKATQTYLAAYPEISVEPLLAYAPELNPEELCHGNIKRHFMNASVETVTDIRRGIDRGFDRLRCRPDMLLGFFHHAGLVVNQLW